MPRHIDLTVLKRKSMGELDRALARYEKAISQNLDYYLLRWIAAMTVVEVYAVWERYAEKRLVAALNHYPNHFLENNDIDGVENISYGLSTVLVRSGAKFFDFRSTSELIDKADRLVGKVQNPFRALNPSDKHYLDTLSAIRNYIVHQSEAALKSYKRSLETTYEIKSKPTPAEFLNAKDFRKSSPARYKSRLHGLIVIIKDSIGRTLPTGSS
jgi:tetratricopeptide (TPR) repeat protein